LGKKGGGVEKKTGEPVEGKNWDGPCCRTGTYPTDGPSGGISTKGNSKRGTSEQILIRVQFPASVIVDSKAFRGGMSKTNNH